MESGNQFVFVVFRLSSIARRYIPPGCYFVCNLSASGKVSAKYRYIRYEHSKPYNPRRYWTRGFG